MRKLLIAIILTLNFSILNAFDKEVSLDIIDAISTFSEKTIGNRIYLKPGYVYVNPEAILLMIGSDLIPAKASILITMGFIPNVVEKSDFGLAKASGFNDHKRAPYF